jgi:hypothetical protein
MLGKARSTGIDPDMLPFAVYKAQLARQGRSTPPRQIAGTLIVETEPP